MYSRRKLKKNGKGALKKHYLLFVVVCLIAAFLGVKNASSLSGLTTTIKETKAVEENTGLVKSGTTSVASGFGGIMNGNSVSRLLSEIGGKLTKAGGGKEQIFGRTRGVFAMVVNQISSGTIMVTIISAVASVVGSRDIALGIFIILSLLLVVFLWVFGVNIYTAVSARIFLEGRVYESVPMYRALFFVRVKKWTHVALTMLRKTIYETLWWLTIVGGVIKSYAYRMVPYIMAENPAMPAGKAITLSRRMMKGHKFECFVLELSFIAWRVLGVATLGLSDIFFTNPYMEATLSEFYVYLRTLAKDQRIEGCEFLNDTYLFERAGRQKLESVYADTVKALAESKIELKERKGIFGLIANIFGVVPFYDEEERAYEENLEKKNNLSNRQRIIEGNIYPGRLCPIPEAEKRRKATHLQYMRHYSIWSMIMLYFSFGFIGWLWEVSLHLISDGEFVNRGVLHGPILPIYGTGGVLILLVLNKFRSKPVAEFFSAIVLCGVVEYSTSVYLELAHNGQKWWDYSGYFLNINGRVCAEGLLVFGLGGMAIVYLAAPALDNLIRRINMKVLIPLCILLLAIFTVDQRYSSVHPNTGEGITSYSAYGGEVKGYIDLGPDICREG